jgi:SAM-dependent methyltransferase
MTRSMLVLCLLLGASASAVPYVPTPDATVDAMLELARVGPRDVVFDLGSGDGRIVIAAALKRGARGVGIEIDPELVTRSEQNARTAGVDKRVAFRLGDLFAADLREATVVTVYLLPLYLERLGPLLRAQLRPGSRVVSHRYPFPDWKADQEVKVGDVTLYLLTVPAAPAPGPGPQTRLNGKNSTSTPSE